MMKRPILFLAVLSAILFGFRFNAYAFKFQTNTPQEFGEDNLKETSHPATSDQYYNITRPKVSYTARGLRNPFEQPGGEGSDERQGTKKERVLPRLTVQGIIWDGNFPQAISENKVVKARDTLEGARIVSISKDGITVIFDGVEHKLTTLPAAGK